MASSAANNQHNKAAGNDGRPRPRIVSCRRGARAKLCGNQIDAVGRGIVSHGTRVALRGQLLNRRIAGSASVDDGERTAAAVRRKGQLVRGVPTGSIGTIANLRRGEHFACRGVGHGHFLAVANTEEPPANNIKSQPGRSVAAGQRPLSSELIGVCVQPD